MTDTFKDIAKLEADLWEAADNLRANSKLTFSDYFMPVLGVIFLRHAANRFEAATRQIEADQVAGRMPRRNLLPANYLHRRALWLPEAARYDWIMQQAATSGSDLPKLITEAMTAIEDEFEPLQGVLPRDYGIFETRVLEDLMRLFNSTQIKQATGDVFGRIYEYFLAKFSMQRAHDNGEFFDRAKAAERNDKVLMLDARQVYRKVTRKIYDFSPEQTKNLSAIVWLYRGQQSRFLTLVRDYLSTVCTEGVAIPAQLATFEKTLADLRSRFSGLVKSMDQDGTLDADKKKLLMDAAIELADAEKPYEADRAGLLTDLDAFRMQYIAIPALAPGETQGVGETNQALHAARRKFDPIAEAIRGLIKQVDCSTNSLSVWLTWAAHSLWRSRWRMFTTGGLLVRLLKQLDEERKAVVEQLKQVAYFHRQVVWLQERFPNAELEAVPGLVKLVDKQEIDAADWSLTPGRYVDVAPLEEDEEFDFETALRDIHTELADLNQEAVELATRIQANFEGLGV